jgi:hypothetical protein
MNIQIMLSKFGDACAQAIHSPFSTGQYIVIFDKLSEKQWSKKPEGEIGQRMLFLLLSLFSLNGIGECQSNCRLSLR